MAGLPRRLVALIYEALLLAAVLLVGALPFVVLFADLPAGVTRLPFQLYLVGLTGVYFTWQWRHGGQTLAMKTWRLRVVMRDGRPVDWRCALRRYFAALAGTLLLGAGFLWALLDREGLFLHDRLAGTKIIMND